MALDERSRHRLHNRLQEVLGDQEAVTLMEALPPVGWADVATKAGLQSLKHELTADIQSLKHELTATFRGEIGSLQQQISSQFRTSLSAMFMLFASFAGLVLAAGGTG